MKRYITYSPRGFANELSIAVFDNAEDAKSFAMTINNDPNSFTLGASSAAHRRVVRNYKRELALHGGRIQGKFITE